MPDVMCLDIINFCKIRTKVYFSLFFNLQFFFL